MNLKKNRASVRGCNLYENHNNPPAFCSFISWHYSGETLQTPQNLALRGLTFKKVNMNLKGRRYNLSVHQMIPLAFNSFILRPRCHRPTSFIWWTLQTPQLLQDLGLEEQLNLIISWPQDELFHWNLCFFGQIWKSSSPKGWEVAEENTN